MTDLPGEHSCCSCLHALGHCCAPGHERWVLAQFGDGWEPPLFASERSRADRLEQDLERLREALREIAADDDLVALEPGSFTYAAAYQRCQSTARAVLASVEENP